MSFRHERVAKVCGCWMAVGSQELLLTSAHGNNYTQDMGFLPGPITMSALAIYVAKMYYTL